MASRHHSLDLSELADMIDVLDGFEAHNSVLITMAFGYDHGSRTPALFMTLDAWETDVSATGQPPLASTRMSTSTMNQKTLMGVLLQGLYQLDFLLAQRELSKEATKKA